MESQGTHCDNVLQVKVINAGISDLHSSLTSTQKELFSLGKLQGPQN